MMVMMRAATSGKMLLLPLLLLLVSSCYEKSTVHGFITPTHQVVRYSKSASSLQLQPWNRFNDKKVKQQSLEHSSFRNKGFRKKIWRNVVAALVSAAAAFGRRGTAQASTESAPLVAPFLTTTQQLEQRLATPQKSQKSATLIPGTVFVAAGAGAVLGWSLVRSKKSSPSSTPEVKDDLIAAIINSAKGVEGDTTKTIPTTTSQSKISDQDERRRVVAQKFVDNVLNRIKIAKRKTFGSLSSPPPPKSSSAADTLSYLDSLSSSPSKLSPKPLTPKAPKPVKQSTSGISSYLDSLSSKTTASSPVVASPEEAALPKAKETIDEVPAEVPETLPSSSSSSSSSSDTAGTSTSLRRRAAAAVLARTNPLQVWSNRPHNAAKAREEQPKSPAEEEALSQKYAAMSVSDRAYHILIDLGMVEPTLDQDE